MAQRAGWAPAGSLIDLGELAGDPLPDRDADAAGVPRWLPPAILIALVLVGLLGDTPRNDLRLVLTTPSAPASFQLADGVLYAFDGSFAPNHLVAYRIRDGRRLWGVTSPHTSTYDFVTSVGGVALLMPNSCVSPTPVAAVAVDRRTGRMVWRREAVPQQPIVGGRLILMSRSDVPYGCGETARAGTDPPTFWEAVDADTGRVVWSVPTSRWVRVLFDSGVGRMATQAVFVAPDGTMTSRNLRTGRVTGQLSRPDLAVPTQPQPADGSPPGFQAPEVAIAGDIAVVVRRRTDEAQNAPARLELAAYDLVTLRQRWSTGASGTTPPQAGTEFYGTSGCGTMLCLYGPTKTVFFDPRDGRERWRTNLSMMVVEGDRGVFGDMGSHGNPWPPEALSIRDLRTGRALAELTSWRPISDGSERTPMLGYVARGRTSLARIDLHTARAVSVGSAPGWYRNCVTEGPYLACRRDDGSVRAWRMTS